LHINDAAGHKNVAEVGADVEVSGLGHTRKVKWSFWPTGRTSESCAWLIGFYVAKRCCEHASKSSAEKKQSATLQLKS